MRCPMVVALVVSATLVRPAAAGILFGRPAKANPAERVPQLLAIVKTDADERKRESAAKELRDFDGAAAIGEGIAQVPELALDFASLDFEVADRRLEPGVPIHQPLVAIDETALVEFDEDMGDGALIALVHGKALALPDDRELVRLAQAGDKEAFEELVRRA